ncbi:MAG: DUF1499 domain-containing protein [Vicinamibacterales bacterium]|jgi:uncharacterized protein (DUF1499 family)|nr:DUF1499 domain-containing protein [Vicinamibacterales bacterium]|tara:strand:+ start:2629 stop:3342 length:714 start_codon:yes stop_codon:yes gene_type:complete
MAGWAVWLALAGGVLVVVAPVLHRVSVLPLGPALLAVPVGILISLVALLLSVTVLVGGRPMPAGRGRVLGAATFSALTGLVPILLVLPGLRAPAIHDITTDLDTPPRFDAVVPLRAGASNSLEHGGATVADAQREAYPDVETLVLSRPLAQVVEQAREVAVAMGWEVVAADAEAGRVEATDTTGWFGFKDDVVVRVRGTDGGSVVDVRSVSRVGVGDLGANAARIRAFLERLAAPTD